MSNYTLYGPNVSLFTRKLEAALRFYELPYAMEPVTPDAATRAATHQVPLLRTPENWLIADTTPLIELLDARRPARRLVPTGPAGVLVHIVEEILDEWYARVMVHYRWHYEPNTRFMVGVLMGQPDITIEEARETPVAQWGPRACRATGTESEHQQRAAEREYLAMLDALEKQLSHTAYALGDRPTSVDAILLGGLRAHTNADPIPDLSAYTLIQAWDAENADRWDGTGELARFPDSTPFAEHVLAVGRDQFVPFTLGNAAAFAAGQKAFTIKTYGEEVSYLTRPYPVRSRAMIQDRIRHQLDDTERAEVAAWLEQWGLAECFMPSTTKGKEP